jgi:uncharacterized protein
MNTTRKGFILALVTLSLAFWLPAGSAAEQAAIQKIRVLVVTGGHGFEVAPFYQVFEDNPNITFVAVEHQAQGGFKLIRKGPDGSDRPFGEPVAHGFFTPDAAKQYDVIVLYDMWPNISEEAKANLMSILKSGKGLVATHHCLAGYPKWDEYANIIGGKYYQEKTVENGVEKPASTYQHDVDFTVQVADPQHPVIRGLKDFKIHDETYGKFGVRPDVKVLLTTEEPTSTRSIGWTKEYGKARVVYLALGHDHLAFENPNYRKLLAQAIQWTAGK